MKGWGVILFCVGLVVAVFGGLAFPTATFVSAVLAILGVIIGVYYVVAAKEINTLLLATIALLVMTAAFVPFTVLGIGKVVTNILVNFAALMAPVALIAAIRALLKVGLEK
ncbi:hypothetical protein ACFLWL_03705 [Chloroflexota bacterium]